MPFSNLLTFPGSSLVTTGFSPSQPTRDSGAYHAHEERNSQEKTTTTGTTGTFPLPPPRSRIDMWGSRLNKETQIAMRQALKNPSFDAQRTRSYSTDAVKTAARLFQEHNVGILSKTDTSDKYPPRFIGNLSDNESNFRDLDPPISRCRSQEDLANHWTRLSRHDHTMPATRTVTQPGHFRVFA